MTGRQPMERICIRSAVKYVVDVILKRLPYHKDYAELLHEGPFQGVLIGLVWGIVCSRLAILGAGGDGFLLDEDIANEGINYGRIDGRIRPRPQDHPGGGQNLERVQHRSGRPKSQSRII